MIHRDNYNETTNFYLVFGTRQSIFKPIFMPTFHMHIYYGYSVIIIASIVI